MCGETARAWWRHGDVSRCLAAPSGCSRVMAVSASGAIAAVVPAALARSPLLLIIVAIVVIVVVHSHHRPPPRCIGGVACPLASRRTHALAATCARTCLLLRGDSHLQGRVSGYVEQMRKDRRADGFWKCGAAAFCGSGRQCHGKSRCTGSRAESGAREEAAQA